MYAEILSIGDEITSGQLLDTNSQWLSLRLEEMGIRVLYHSAVGDELEPLAAAFRQAMERSDVVIATGGLGPTADDLTRDAVAQATGCKLELRPEALEHVRSLFARRKREMPKQNEVQALFPVGSQIIPNPDGTAPGIDVELAREGKTPSRLFCLPGVPAEMREMWFGTVADRLRQMGAGQRVIRQRKINCFGAGESQIESMLPDLIRRGRVPRVGINASKTTIILRITAEGPTEEACDAAMEPTIATIRQCLGKLVFGEGDEELQHAVVHLLRQQSQTLATLEWGTAGLIADWLGDVAGSEGHFAGGLVATSGRAMELATGLCFDPTGDISQLIQAAAEAYRQRFQADYGLVVGPFPPLDPNAAQPKSVMLGLAMAEGSQVKEVAFAGHPATLKIYCAKQALNLVRLALLG
jgi:nicotinamide-nucleotide amidase